MEIAIQSIDYLTVYPAYIGAINIIYSFPFLNYTNSF